MAEKMQTMDGLEEASYAWWKEVVSDLLKDVICDKLTRIDLWFHGKWRK